MSGQLLRRSAAAAALVVGAALGACALFLGTGVPTWSVPIVAAGGLLLGELVSLSRGLAPEATVERRAAHAVAVGRVLTAALLAVLGATVALLAAAVPARHGLAIGLVGALAALGLVRLVAALARRRDPTGTPA